MSTPQRIDGTRLAKVNVLCWLAACFVTCSNAAHIQFTFRDASSNALVAKTVRLVPTNSTVAAVGGAFITDDALQKTTDTSGQVTFSNIQVSAFHALIWGQNRTSVVSLASVPVSSNAVLNATNYFVPSIPASVARFLAAGTNILFTTNAGVLTIHGTAVGGSGGSATNAIADVLTNNVTALANARSIEFTNVPGWISFNVRAVGTKAIVSAVPSSSLTDDDTGEGITDDDL
jgi:hypothetical protein